MAFSLKVPPPWDSQGWKVKIRDRERLEPPHVTILHRIQSWRWDLRTEQFLDTDPEPKSVPKEIEMVVRQNVELLRRVWDRMYPQKPAQLAGGTDMSTELLLVDPKGAASSSLSHLDVPRLRAVEDVREALARASRTILLWIAPNGLALDLLLQTLPHRPRQDHRLLVLNHFAAELHNLLHAHFRFVVAKGNGMQLLPIRELAQALGAERRDDLFIGGAVVRSELLLYRGSLEPLSVPLSWFASRPDSPEPDLRQFAVTDYGQTVRLGAYEASTDSILYEFDEQYRARAKKRLRTADTSFGGALRRLRLMKGLRQNDFPGVTSKEIARIENGVVRNPRADTLRKIAKKTGVPVDQIRTY